MTVQNDRRSPSVRRVDLTTLVDICSTEGQLGPFQAESANVSGRGMQVRTGYLPELGQELVCRFEHEGHEILVEGRVAWRSEGEDGGEFGLKFTALDADSADILRKLGEAPRSTLSRLTGLGRVPEPEPEENLDASPGRLELAAGQRVRLHMDGLGAPMKAAVHLGNDRKIRVGSNLEFLKVGRSLEVEEIEGGERRTALVDAVNVIINPATSIPELVVQLRYEGVSPTPPPARVGAERPAAPQATAAEATTPEPRPEARGRGSQRDEELDPEDTEPDEGTLGAWADDALTEKISGFMSRAGEVAAFASGRLGSVAHAVARSATSVARARPKKQPQPEGNTPRRLAKRRVQQSRARQAQAPAHLRSGIHDLKMTGQAKGRAAGSRVSRSAESEPAPPKRGRTWVAFLALTLALGSAAALRWTSSEMTPAQADAEVSAAPAPESPVSAPPAVAKVKSAEAPRTKEGIVAEVPLFGERAVASGDATPSEEPAQDEASLEKLAAAALVPDETWDEPEKESVQDETPWGRGRLHLPTIHRIRLDGAGGKLSGATEPNGFVVVVPGRKAMESGRAIQKRDKRIAAVSSSNSEQGAKVRFQFRGPVPPYRVRLRQDFLEFLISAPEEGVAKL